MLALLPLDDRPCNRLFPVQLARIAGQTLLTPPRELLGRFNTPGQPAALQAWLEDLPAVERLIVSIDMLAYGGLVASRKTHTALETALERLELLRDWKNSRPETPISAFNVLMRLAITMDSDEAVPHYYNVMRYARLCDEARRFPTPANQSELEEVKRALPAAILAEYHAARARNHAVNLAMLDWLGDDAFDFLLITQEDCTRFGLHRQEQEALAERVQTRHVSDKFALHPGADEAALTLLARSWNTRISFELRWSDEAAKRAIAVFEDVPYEDALHSHVAAMGGRIVNTNGDVVLFINAPVGGSQKDQSAAERESRQPQIERFVAEIAQVQTTGRPCALCDVAFPNGADNLLMETALRAQVLGRLSAFGGWNTAGNTTGTVLAQCAALEQGRRVLQGAAARESEHLNRTFTFERLLDDWIYQSNVRSDIESIAREQGLSPLNMDKGATPIEDHSRTQLTHQARELAQRIGFELQEIEACLPWGRTFEAEIAARLA